jgi:hypothetical protein
MEFVTAARAMGASWPRIMFVHVLRNALAPVLVPITFGIAAARVEELHERAWEVVRPRCSEAQQKAAARYRQLAGTGQTSKDIREIVAAAYYGRIETLFAASGIQVWGDFDPAAGQVDLHEGPEGEDLLEFAAIQTVLHQGTVYVTSPENMPEDADAVSIFRY